VMSTLKRGMYPATAEALHEELSFSEA